MIAHSRSPSGWWIFLTVLLLVACATAPPAPLRPAESSRARPWQMPEDEYPSQRLYRVEVAGKTGSGNVKLSLRYWRPGDYEARALDALGRPLWTLSVINGAVLMIDFRHHSYCQSRGELRLPVLDFGPLPVEALPRLLIGRLPLPPAVGESAPGKGDGRFHFDDSRGRAWSGELKQGWPVRWTVGDPDPLIWWKKSGAGGILSRRGGGQLRWQQEVREPLAAAARPEAERPSPPSEFRKVSCGEPDIP